MKYFIGIDGGGSKTHCILTDLNANKLFECFNGPVNLLTKETEISCRTVFSLLKKCSEGFNFSFNEIVSVVLGAAGAGRKTDAEKFEKVFLEFLSKEKIILNDFFVCSDALIALEGAFAGKPGCIIISGTGSIMLGKDEKGNIHRVGGFGRIIGDEGGGFMLGKKGLNAVAKSFDGRGKSTLIKELVQQKFNINSQEMLINEIYNNALDISSIAPLVLEAGGKGDEIANKIVEDETEEIIIHIFAMSGKINTKELNVSFAGSIITNENYFLNILKEKIHKRLPNVHIHQAKYSPAFGAVLLAQERIKNKSL
jgi:N-acetylglucosamine kinase-like BadF-type ATPase